MSPLTSPSAAAAGLEQPSSVIVLQHDLEVLVGLVSLLWVTPLPLS